MRQHYRINLQYFFTAEIHEVRRVGEDFAVFDRFGFCLGLVKDIGVKVIQIWKDSEWVVGGSYWVIARDNEKFKKNELLQTLGEPIDASEIN